MPLWMRRFIQTLAAVACLLTAISVFHSNLWWIRILDFPRTSMLAAIIVLLVGTALFVRKARALTMVGLVLAGAWQVWRIWDYTPLAAEELALDAAAQDDEACFTALGFNVFQHNRDYARTIALLQREQPDVLLLMETDAPWLAALAPVLSTFPHVSERALDNTYGMIFASRLDVRNARFLSPTSADTPTFYATLSTPGGREFDYVGLHPRPPLPGQSTEERDASILRAAQRQVGDATPAVVMGDFNDVAWSRTTQQMKSKGGFLDPRIGRGLYATFPAAYATVGWPLDHIVVTPVFAVGAVRVLENVGSDHRALVARLCLREPSTDG